MAEDDGGFERAGRLYPDYVNHASVRRALSRGGAALVIGGSGLFDEEAFAALKARGGDGLRAGRAEQL